MAGKFHRLRKAVTEAGLGGAKAFADMPAGYALSADLAVPAGPAPPDYALAVERQTAPARAQRNRLLYWAAAAALALHIAPAIFFVAERPEPSRQLGTEEGRAENLNFSLITEAELDRLHSSVALRDQSARPGPLGPAETPPTEAPEIPAPPQPAAQEAETAPSFPQPRANASRNPSFDPSAYAAMASNQFSAELNQAFKAIEARQHQAAAKRASAASGRVRSIRPGATHLGKSDEFERAVVWALGATVPEGNGKWGITVVTFTVSASGLPDGLRLLKSSGDNWLDSASLMAVKQARLPSPPSGLPAGDRTFVIEYDYILVRSRGR